MRGSWIVVVVCWCCSGISAHRDKARGSILRASLRGQTSHEPDLNDLGSAVGRASSAIAEHLSHRVAARRTKRAEQRLAASKKPGDEPEPTLSPEEKQEIKEETRDVIEEELAEDKKLQKVVAEEIEKEVGEEVEEEIEKEVKEDLAKKGIGTEERMSPIGEQVLQQKWVIFSISVVTLIVTSLTLAVILYFSPPLGGEKTDGSPSDSPAQSPRGSVVSGEDSRRIETLSMTRGLPISVLLSVVATVILLPFGCLAGHFGMSSALVFWINLMAVVPEAYLLGFATEELASHLGNAAGAILNASFGNCVELVFVYYTVKDGLLDATIGSLVGSIISNHLVLLGFAFLFGGVLAVKPYKIRLSQDSTYDKVGAINQAQQLLLASFTVTLPAIFATHQHVTSSHVLVLGQAFSFFLIFCYIFSVFFQLRFQHVESEHESAVLSVRTALGVLVASTICLAISSEFMVHALDDFCHRIGMSQTFVGIALLPVAGDLSHMGAVVVAMKGKMDLAINIALASAIQIALVVVPASIWMGYAMGQPMTLGFQHIHGAALIISAIMTFAVLVDGHANWLRGATLIVTWIMVCLVYFFMPDHIKE
eukprot:TRINITY_DN102591_c0_g1_i1.p1 TRINITY_DN102591_c0_g1~~TRINITY_DN102591_c0_g1_i1.p1  ORF type:complete len:594 (+),score=113.78 TRINITY_DN102591_c0_g1_i1:134-1915(+)